MADRSKDGRSADAKAVDDQFEKLADTVTNTSSNAEFSTKKVVGVIDEDGGALVQETRGEPQASKEKE